MMLALRTCVGCRREDAAGYMLRFVRGKDGMPEADVAGRALGRGAHIHPVRKCFDVAVRGGLSRALRAGGLDLGAAQALREQVRLGLERELRRRTLAAERACPCAERGQRARAEEWSRRLATWGET